MHLPGRGHFVLMYIVLETHLHYNECHEHLRLWRAEEGKRLDGANCYLDTTWKLCYYTHKHWIILGGPSLALARSCSEFNSKINFTVKMNEYCVPWCRRRIYQYMRRNMRKVSLSFSAYYVTTPVSSTKDARNEYTYVYDYYEQH